MLKNILNLEGAQELSGKEQKEINGESLRVVSTKLGKGQVWLTAKQQDLKDTIIRIL